MVNYRRRHKGTEMGLIDVNTLQEEKRKGVSLSQKSMH